MAHAIGVGGIFFRSIDPMRLKQWYLEMLGVGSGNGAPWEAGAGPLVFEPFAFKSDYFPLEQKAMINFRVDDLDALAARLEAAGVAVTRKAEWDHPEYGRFARIADPDGNDIELWQPA